MPLELYTCKNRTSRTIFISITDNLNPNSRHVVSIAFTCCCGTICSAIDAAGRSISVAFAFAFAFTLARCASAKIQHAVAVACATKDRGACVVSVAAVLAFSVSIAVAWCFSG